MRLHSSRALVLGLLALIASPVQADVVVTVPGGGFQLDFNLGATSRTSVQQYVDNILGPGKVTVTGAFWGNGYNGEGFVVGPTLGADGGNFIITDQNTGDHAKITMTFAQPISSIRFDYEIFPDGTVPDGRNVNPSNYPDFTFNAYLNGSLLTDQSFRTLAQMPTGFTGHPQGEFTPQFLGSAFVVFPNGADKLEFVDWPPTVGVDNFRVNSDVGVSAVVPEPGSAMILMSVGFMAWFCLRRAKQFRRMTVGAH